MLKSAAAAVVAFPGCSAAAPAERYELMAYEAPGMLPMAGEIIMPDARERIPSVLRACGITDVEIKDATDGVVVFRFHAAANRLPCLNEKLPRGTRLHPFGTQ